MKKGFLCTIGRREFFLISEQTKRTQAAVNAMLKGIATFRGFSPEKISACMNDKSVYKDIQYKMSPAVLEKRTTESGYIYYNISGRDFSCSYPVDDFKNDVVIIGGTII